ncbi:cell division protein FtsQ/DivIB [Jeotgalibacillus sp. ET6]|uniref:cell division protein FtsQ/DivIB n=1 Tax=Jeotgalibacillus sp. ET6 TaxID=3037260 RepID=UPI00241823FA|nr:cell division protein FtsQ/DivIB [Jeotgalibacillus sp. ET6]MDG5470205.1 cell division protein FtsQ/DivIB [Jeotgalibacillus sp. ET6]
MGRKPVVSLEDRVPQLKQRRRKKANRRMLAVVMLFVLIILVILYFQSSFSKVQQFSIEGTEWHTDEKVIEATGVNIGDSYWTTDAQAVEDSLLSQLEVESAEVTKKFPTTFTVKINEYDHVAFIQQDQQFVPVLENGALMDAVPSNELPSHAPLLFGFVSDSVLKEMAGALSKLPAEVQQSVSEVHLTPDDTDAGHISVYMNDGFEVSAIIDTFAEKMEHYPSIITQLDPDVKGIIDLEVGSYFRAYETSNEEVQESVEDEEAAGEEEGQ